MTTTTRTTRKAPWAAVLTALLAVIALVFGALVIAGPATADPDPDKTPPGHSETFVPPGQQGDNGGGNDKPDDYLPPGQNPDWTPPGQVEGDGPGSPGYKVWICHADTNHGNGQPNLGQGGTGGEYGVGFNLIEVAWSAWVNSHNRLHPSDYLATNGEVAQGYCGTTDDVTTSVCVSTGTTTYALKTFTGVAGTDQSTWTNDGAPMSTFTVVDMALCTPVNPTPASVEYCVVTGPGTYGLMTFSGMTNTAETTWVNGTQPLSAFTKVDRALCITPEEAAAIDAAIAATEPETVAPVLPATVAEEPETVAVPAPATVPMPATVPAGDGSTVPQVPVALLALLALATAAAVTSGLRMATNR